MKSHFKKKKLEVVKTDTSIYTDLESYLSAKFKFKYNVVSGRLFYCTIDSTDYVEMGEFEFNSIVRQCNKANIKTKTNELIQLLQSDFTPNYNPFELYLKGLPKWDGNTDYIDMCANSIQCHDQTLWGKCFKKWVIALVGSLIDDATVNHTAPILCGGQGIGKTRWIGRLVPEQLKKYFFSGTININNKDSLTQLSECMLIDMDELENLGKKSIGDLKSLMTKEQILVRRPYGKMSEKLPRRASFIGSINDKEFLRDGTGSRRFLCFDVESIESVEIDIDMVFSQAVQLYKSGEQFWFDREETEEIEFNNEQFQKSYYEEELLLNHFIPVNQYDADAFYSTTDIARILNTREKLSVNNTTIQHLGKVLSSKKFQRIKHKGKYCWAVKDLKEMPKLVETNNIILEEVVF